jgi:diketogulonate reductase-like aldo/keto reductase
MNLWTPTGNVTMPLIGLGTAFGHDAAGMNTTYEGVRSWLKNGGRAIHGAWMYCNQEAIGKAIKDSGVPRKELFIMSMVPQWSLGYESTVASLNATLDELGLEYVDLYMMHWPGMFSDSITVGSTTHIMHCGVNHTAQAPACKRGKPNWRQCRKGTWQAMRDLQAAGKIRALGTSNFEVAHMEELIKWGARPSVNQVEFHVGYHDDYLQKWCLAHGIQQQAYSPLGRGQLPTTKAPAVLAAAQAHNVTAAQVALRFVVQNGLAAIPKGTCCMLYVNGGLLYANGCTLNVNECVLFAVIRTPLHYTLSRYPFLPSPRSSTPPPLPPAAQHQIRAISE